MQREEKLSLIQRSLGIRHKLKVHESMKAPETHEDLALMLMAKWELEDELRAIEELLTQDRLANVKLKREIIETDFLGEPDEGRKPESESRVKKLKKKR